MASLDDFLEYYKQKELKSVSASPKVSKPDTVWNTKYQPVLDELKLDKNINYSNSLHMMKAINGRYDKLLSSDIDPKIKETIKTLKKSSTSAMNEFVKLKTGGYDADKATNYLMDAQKADILLANSLNYFKKKGYVYDHETKNIYDRKTFEKKAKVPVLEPETTTQTNAGGGGVNLMDGYIQLKGYSDIMTKTLKDKINPIVTAWTDNATRILNADDKEAGKFDPDNRLNTYNISVDILKHIAKHGTVSGNSDADAQNKTQANRMLKKLQAVESYTDKLNLIKQFTNVNDENLIVNFSKNLGYYGTTSLYNKYKKKLGSNEKYLTNIEGTDKQFDNIDGMLAEFQDYKKSETEWRQSAVKQAELSATNPMKEAIYEQLLNKTGNIEDFDTWKYKMRSAGRLAPMLHQNKSSFLSWYGQAWGADKGEQDWSGHHDYDKVARNVYNDAVKNFKLRFSDLKFNKQIKGQVKVIQFGNTVDHNISYLSMDFSQNKDGYLKKTEGKKSENANILYNIMRKDDGSIDSENITLLNNEQTKMGLYKNATKDDLLDYKKTNEAVFNDFFKKSNPNDVKVTYIKNASLSHHGAYIFKNNETGKSITMIAPNKLLNESKEPLYVNMYTSSSEYRYQQLGKRSLPDLDGVYKKAIIYDRDGQKTASWKFENKDGEIEEFEHVLGDIDIETATKKFNDLMSNFKRLKSLENEK